MTVTVNLRDRTTLHLGGAASSLVEACSETELIDALRAADDSGEPVLILGGGSNLVVSDDGFPGRVIRDARSGIDVVDSSDCAGVTVTVLGGTTWDDVVAMAVANGWAGIEALSGIPGSAGATPVQNVGAYGQEVADTIAQVRTWDREQNRIRTFTSAELGFAYRSSMLKRTMMGVSPRFAVLDVTFQLGLTDRARPPRFGELVRRLGVEEGGTAPLAAVRETVLELRAGKGMVVDPADHDTWSAGSFFMNPILTEDVAADLPPDAPRFPALGARTSAEPAGELVPGLVKTSAAWLIEHAGFARGFTMPGGREGSVGLSTKHTLALTNRGDGTTAELLDLARLVRDGVAEAFGVVLVPEPVLVNCEL